MQKCFFFISCTLILSDLVRKSSLGTPDGELDTKCSPPDALAHSWRSPCLVSRSYSVRIKTADAALARTKQALQDEQERSESERATAARSGIFQLSIHTLTREAHVLCLFPPPPLKNFMASVYKVFLAAVDFCPSVDRLIYRPLEWRSPSPRSTTSEVCVARATTRELFRGTSRHGALNIYIFAPHRRVREAETRSAELEMALEDAGLMAPPASYGEVAGEASLWAVKGGAEVQASAVGAGAGVGGERARVAGGRKQLSALPKATSGGGGGAGGL
jgi:hypothetical protein